MDYNARVELDSRDFDESAVDVLMDVLEPYDGTVARAIHGGRIELIFTLPAGSLRQAAGSALAIAATAGHKPYAVEVLPTDEFHRRVNAAPVPELMSVTQAADALGVSRQRVLQLARNGQLDAVKVGDTWVIPRTAAATRGEQTGLRFTGLVLPVGVASNLNQVIDDDAIDVHGPLLVHDDRGRLIGQANTVRREAAGWTVVGVVRGLTPGEYSIIPQVEGRVWNDSSDVRRLVRGQLHSLTVVTGPGRESGFPQARVTIEVSDRRATLTLPTDQPVQGQVEMVSFP
ncbi:helix-turn-helix domain-containing protein [Geodermatophilus sp. DSM 45219]|uniref:helix-turn-helix domain-containing protein n=1 Tax=Geodermatophilus sp. DSM 45219 TaxID=1881103 RepID=UPI0008832F97|nr:helix-turn-helix domain-containing protein [Geodermatophilus sp. DSM 45219]SDN41970.1 DNA binding domain-containing protein, excisionase family [Geodermatophilus sp. DSM 45219]